MSVLRTDFAHNKGGPANINIAQLLNHLNFFELKFWFRFTYENNKLEQWWILN